MSRQRTVLIAGGGMVGVSLALKLAAELPADVAITLVEGFQLPDAGAPAYHPSFDARSTALSYSSRRIYQDLELWQDLARWACPIDTIHVSNRGRFGSTLLRAADYDWPALGYVVENSWLGNALLQALRKRNRVQLLSPARVVQAAPAAGGVELQLDNGGRASSLIVDLLVVADGAASGLRRSLGVATMEKNYPQHALIANVGFARPHLGCAFERFTDQGPLALLPLLAAAGDPAAGDPAAGGRPAAANHRSALVWTLPPAQAQHLQACDEGEFLAALQLRFGYRLGRMLQVGARHSYPLALLESSEQVRPGIVVMGNAAHTLHPVAGQGFNLALRDVAELSRSLAAAATAGKALGELSVLSGYQQRQLGDQHRTIAFSDILPGLFMRTDPVLGLIRDLALSGLDMLTPLKREFVRHAAGIASLDTAHG